MISSEQKLGLIIRSLACLVIKILCVIYNFAPVLFFFPGKRTEFLLLCLNDFIHLRKFPGVDQWLISPHNEKNFQSRESPLCWHSSLTQQGLASRDLLMRYCSFISSVTF